MAEGGRIPILGRSVDFGSDEIFEYECMPCNKRNQFSKATLYCPNCNVLYCKRCSESKHGDTTCHKVVSISNWGQKNIDKCPVCEEDDSNATRFCGDHNTTCCIICEELHHSSCASVFEIAAISTTLVNDKYLDCMKDELKTKIDATQKILDKTSDAQIRLDNTRAKSLEELNNFRREIKEIVDKMETETRDEIDECYYDIIGEYESDIDDCGSFLADLRLQMMLLENSKLNRCQQLVMASRIKKMFHNRDKWLGNRASTPQCSPENITFCGNPSLICYLKNVKYLRPTHGELNKVNVSTQTENCDNSYDPNHCMVMEISDKLAQVFKQNPNQELSRNLFSDIMARLTKDEISENQPVDTVHEDLANTSRQIMQNRHHPSHAKILHKEAPFHVQAPKSYTPVTHVQSEICKLNTMRPFATTEHHLDQIQQKHEHLSRPILRRTISDFSDRNSACLFPRIVQKESVATRKTEVGHTYSIKLKHDTHQCNIQGIYGLPNGNILLSDTKNKKLKTIDQDYSITDYCDLPSGPRGVCCVGEYIAALAMSNNTIQFVTLVPKLKPTTRLPMDHDCYGISHYNGKLYVTEQNGKVVYVYNTSGYLLNKITDNDMTGSLRFRSTQHVYITRDGARIYVADKHKGLVTIKSSGGLLCSLSQPELKSACGVCTDIRGNVYVSGIGSHNVVKFGDRGTTARGPIVSAADGIDYPIAIWFNSFKSQLIVSNQIQAFGNDYISVYEIERDTWDN